jgi:hypothetical protein
MIKSHRRRFNKKAMTRKKEHPRKAGSNSIQGANKKKRAGVTSQYFGVFWNKQKGKWQAKMSINYEQKHIGSFDDELKAGLAYMWAGIKHYGPDFRIEDQKRLNLITAELNNKDYGDTFKEAAGVAPETRQD